MITRIRYKEAALAHERLIAMQVSLGLRLVEDLLTATPLFHTHIRLEGGIQLLYNILNSSIASTSSTSASSTPSATSSKRGAQQNAAMNERDSCVASCCRLLQKCCTLSPVTQQAVVKE